MRELMMTFVVATALMFVGGLRADAATWSRSAGLAAAAQTTDQVETAKCRRHAPPDGCGWGRWWNGRWCVRCW
jgi:hypothetical protein